MNSSVLPNINNSNKIIITAIPAPALDDNYIWAITAINNDFLVLVDPGDASVCIDFIKKNNKKLCAILVTHHHYDHIDGIEALVKYSNQNNWQTTVYGPANETIPHCDIKLTESDNINIDELNLTFSIIDLPGHTLGHIAYFSNQENENNLFCGDTLFSGGCGRIMEGTPFQMLTALKKLAHLPKHTKVFCTHEYTLANLTFALTVEPDNETLQHYHKEVVLKRKNNVITLPSSIEKELAINPFLRCSQTTIKVIAENNAQAQLMSELDVFTTIRKMKNRF